MSGHKSTRLAWRQFCRRWRAIINAALTLALASVLVAPGAVFCCAAPRWPTDGRGRCAYRQPLMTCGWPADRADPPGCRLLAPRRRRCRRDTSPLSLSRRVNARGLSGQRSERCPAVICPMCPGVGEPKPTIFL